MLNTARLPTVLANDCKRSPHKSVDHVLLASIAMGDKRAMERLFARHHQRVYHFVYRITGNASLAEEIVSDVFLAAWRGAATFEAKSQVCTWLLAIARHKAMTALRRPPEAQLDDDDASAIVDDAASPELQSHLVRRNALLQQCLTQLSPSHRELIDLVYYHEQTISDVARIVGIPSGTVKSRMMAARQRLAELLKDAGLDRFQEC